MKEMVCSLLMVPHPLEEPCLRFVGAEHGDLERDFCMEYRNDWLMYPTVRIFRGFARHWGLLSLVVLYSTDIAPGS
jgi:hypothetical protein